MYCIFLEHNHLYNQRITFWGENVGHTDNNTFQIGNDRMVSDNECVFRTTHRVRCARPLLELFNGLYVNRIGLVHQVQLH